MRNWLKQKLLMLAIAGSSLLPIAARSSTALPLPKSYGTTASIGDAPRVKYVYDHPLLKPSAEFPDFIPLDVVANTKAFLNISKKPMKDQLGGVNNPLRLVWPENMNIRIDRDRGEIFYDEKLVLSYSNGAHIYGATEKELRDGWGAMPISTAARQINPFYEKSIGSFEAGLSGAITQPPSNGEAFYWPKKPEHAGIAGSYAYERQNYDNHRIAEYNLRNFKPVGTANYDTTHNEFIWKIARKESNFDPFSVNGFGYRGLGQFGMDALQTVGLTNHGYFTGVICGGQSVRTEDEFLANPYAQVTALWNYMAHNAARIPAHWLGKTYTYTDAQGVQKSFVTNHVNLAAGMHLLGFSGMKDVIENGAQRVDGNGITFQQFAGNLDCSKVISSKNLAAYDANQASALTLIYHDHSTGTHRETISAASKDPEKDGCSPPCKDSKKKDGKDDPAGGIFGSAKSTWLVAAGIAGGAVYLANKEDPKDIPSKPREAAAVENVILSATTPTLLTRNPAITSTNFYESNALSPSTSGLIDNLPSTATQSPFATKKPSWFTPKKLAMVALTAGVAYFGWEALRGNSLASSWLGRALASKSAGGSMQKSL